MGFEYREFKINAGGQKELLAGINFIEVELGMERFMDMFESTENWDKRTAFKFNLYTQETFVLYLKPPKVGENVILYQN